MYSKYDEIVNRSSRWVCSLECRSADVVRVLPRGHPTTQLCCLLSVGLLFVVGWLVGFVLLGLTFLLSDRVK